MVEFTSCVILHFEEMIIVVAVLFKRAFRDISKIELISPQIRLTFGVFLDIVVVICTELQLIVIIPPQQSIISLRLPTILLIILLFNLVLILLFGYMCKCSSIEY